MKGFLKMNFAISDVQYTVPRLQKQPLFAKKRTP